MKSEMKLKYSTEAGIFNEGTRFATANSWESLSLPLGNGYFGANVFGRTQTERIQISEPTLANPWYRPKIKPKGPAAAAAGVNSFAEIYLDFNHSEVSEYERGLTLDDAITYVRYRHSGILYEREIFTSHPDRLMAMRITADKMASLSFSLRAEIPFLGEYTVEEGDGLSKTGEVKANGDTLTVSGEMGYYKIEYFGAIKVVNVGGELSCDGRSITVRSADEAIIYFSCDTNYELSEKVFTEKIPSKKLAGRRVDKDKIISIINRAAKATYASIKVRHLNDYHDLFCRAELSVDAPEASLDCLEYTDVLLRKYREGRISTYLEILLFQYGRYLLIASSRNRLPAHLQGIWNAYCDSPWSCGYWHNINVQMNYWLSGPANLAELFLPYINYAKAYMKYAEENADEFIRTNYPENFEGEGKNGWIIWTAARGYDIERLTAPVHSGPGTGAFTSLLFWDYYDFTRDLDFLREFGYPALLGMSRFFTKALAYREGKYLIRNSASPEVRHGGEYYLTEGCAFDQQMVYENFKRTTEAAKILVVEDDFTRSLAQMLPHLDPVLIGDDGQVKEFREESTYCSIGDERQHRHISHLVGLYPLAIINDNTPEWLEGAKITLQNRGDISGGWAIAHRILLWSMAKNGDKCKHLMESLIKNKIYDNLWDMYPPFQIDGNFGFTAGVCEMLLQSHSGYIELLPALPKSWHSGEFSGLVARGNYEVSCKWQAGKIESVRVLSRSGGRLKIKLPEYLLTDAPAGGYTVYEREMSENECVQFSR